MTTNNGVTSEFALIKVRLPSESVVPCHEDCMFTDWDIIKSFSYCVLLTPFTP